MSASYREPPPFSPVSSRTRNANTRLRSSAPGRSEASTSTSHAVANARSASLVQGYGSQSNSDRSDSIGLDGEQSNESEVESSEPGAEDEAEVKSKNDRGDADEDDIGSKKDGEDKDEDEQTGRDRSGEGEDAVESTKDGEDEDEDDQTGRDRNGESGDGAGRGWRRRWKPYFLIAFIAVLLACVAGLLSEPPVPAPPCHVLGNPNHFVPCAISIDLNRALSAIPRQARPAGQDDFFALTEPSLDDSDMDDMLTFHRYVQTADQWHGHLERVIFTIVNNIKAADSRAESDASSSSLAPYLLGLLFSWAAFPLQHDTVGLKAAAKELFHAVYQMASQRHSDRQAVVNRAYVLLQQRIKQQQLTNQRVHRLSQNTGHMLSAAQAVSKLNSERQYLLRLLLSEAVLTCWLEGVQQLESTFHAWSQKVWKDGQIFLHRVRHTNQDYHSRNLLRIVITDQARQWSDEARTMVEDAHSSALGAERSCAKRWAEKKLGYCIANKQEVTENVYQNWTELDPTGSGCISHPDKILWEWHNAIPLQVDFDDDGSYESPFSQHSRRARFWMHRVFNHVRMARTTRVSTSGESIEFHSRLLLTIGPLRFWKIEA
ncbi:hypothetical protein AC578_4345 [Pseudocercospora eumusae]|uniref:Uncharacterized protein n=1 Tax=Pseudocercospora eumusae TaxID=321146 RepID=A0A139H5P9_9PEZI|nr:hypothetical protein AC578_4345 [Pseudocercospora eumusae]